MNHLKFRISFKKFLITAGSAFLILLLLLLGIIWYLAASAPGLDEVNISPSQAATYILDSTGKPLRKLTLASSNRDIVALEDISPDMQHAMIAIEDERFYSHNGIDLRGIMRAFVTGIARGSFSEGASTITQQLIKNSVFTEWMQETSFADRFRRKVQEQYLALQLEKQMSKNEILEHYLNTINFGAGCYGVQTASLRYFGKNASELTLSEAAVLAAIPQNPSALNPIRYPEKNRIRQETILEYMQKQGYITEEEHAQALTDDVYARIHAYDASYEDETVFSSYEDALITQVIDTLQNTFSCTYDQAYRAVYSGGLRIWSAQDPGLQQICDEEFQNPSNFPEGIQFGIDYALSTADEDGLVTHYGSDALRAWIRKTINPGFDLMCASEEAAREYTDAFREHILEEYRTGTSGTEHSAEKPETGNSVDRFTVLGERLTLSPQPQASLVLIEQDTGFVRALIGGRGEKTASLTLNRASETLRQPGSTFKILTAYAPALDAYGQTLATVYDNEPYEYSDGTPVSNWDVSDYSGSVTIREAITRSINIAAVKCITDITPRVGFDYATRFGITTLHESWQSGDTYATDLVQPLALGGITEGVSNLELCGAYAAIANGGLFVKPCFFTKILDRNGKILLDYSGRSAASSEESSAAVAAAPEPGTLTGDFTRILQESTAYLLTSAMQDVTASPDGTAYGSIHAAGLPVAGKTGTTSSYKDIWFVGYTPYYTCSVWGGYDNNEELPDGSTYHSYSKSLWSAVMNRIHADLPYAGFSRPESIVSVLLCSESHLPAKDDACPHIYTEYFAEGTQPTAVCDLHEPIPDPEPIIIYQDLLEELLTESESETETESDTTESDSAASETDTDTQETNTDILETDTNPPENIQPETNGGISNTPPTETEAGDSETFPSETDSGETETSTSETDSEGTETSASGTDSEGTGTSASGTDSEENEALFSETMPEDPGNSTDTQKIQNQPDTSSLEDLLRRLDAAA